MRKFSRFSLVNFAVRDRAKGAAWLLWRYRLPAALLLVVCVFGAELKLQKLPEVSAAYSIANSARFISGNTDYLTRTPGVAGNRQKWTQSFLFKRGNLATQQSLFTAWSTASAYTAVEIGSDDKLDVYSYDAGYSYRKQTNAVFRDPAAWNHIVVAVDTTQATATDRVKVYVNGVQVTSFTVSTDPSQNYNSWMNTANGHNIGRRGDNGISSFDGYFSDYYIIDGQQLAPTCFGAYDTNGYWRPVAYNTGSCGSYGTNGVHLAFGSGAALGTDTSGNSNTWTTSGLASTDQVTDTPTNSFATMGPAFDNSGQSWTVASGNLDTKNSNFGALYYDLKGLIGVSSGKWYWEYNHTVNANIGTPTLTASQFPGVGIIVRNANTGQTSSQTYLDVGYFRDGTIRTGNSTAQSSLATFTITDVIGIALNADAQTVQFYKNNVAVGSAQSYTTSNFVLPAIAQYDGSEGIFNFGQGGQSGLTYDSASGGNFVYTPPSGFKALSTVNLPVPTVTVPSQYFNAALYTGTGETRNVYGTATATTTVYLRAGTTSWTVPADWNSTNNTIEVIGGGGGGGSGRGEVVNGGLYAGGGGGGGAYAKVTNVALQPGVVVTVGVATTSVGGDSADHGNGIGAGATGGDTFLCNLNSACASISGTAVVVGAKGGAGGVGSGGAGGAGGASGSSVGTVKNSGGKGGDTAPGVGGGGPGGGGAGGPNGAGNAGTNATSNSGTVGGSGDAGSGGAGSSGGTTATAGGAGTEWDATHGSGGGAGGGAGGPIGASGHNGAIGGAYGGGGSGGAGDTSGVTWSTVGGSGMEGLIVIKYVPLYSTFQPDLAWIKDRTAATSSLIFDSVRTATKYWSSNANTAEQAAANTLTAFLANGFTLGAASGINTVGNAFVAWMWKKSPTTDGVDIVTYTGDNTANRTISHSLGKRPAMVIVKRRDSAGDSYVWQASFKDATTYALLDSTAATSTSNTPWGTGDFNASTFMVTNDVTNNLNVSSATYVAYVFATTTGFSDFGSYSGNGSADGPFVYTGFKPRWVMIKDASAINHWFIFDTARSPNNPVSLELYANDSSAEPAASARLDTLSNGFKLRTSSTVLNSSSDIMVYAAFADVPFYYSAQPSSGSGAANASAFLMGMPY